MGAPLARSSGQLALDAFECQSYPGFHGRPSTVGHNGGGCSRSRSSCLWRGCSGRSRARCSSPGPTGTTCCGRGRATPAPRTWPGCSAGRPAPSCSSSTSPRVRPRPEPVLASAAGAGHACSGSPQSSATRIPLYRKGGKGVAAAGGALVVLYPLVVVGLAVCWFLVARVLHKASLASLLATILFPIAVLLLGYDRWESRASSAAWRYWSSPVTRETFAGCYAARNTIWARRRTGPRRLHETGAQGGDPGGRARHALLAGDQELAQGDAARRRQARDPVRGRGGREGGPHRHPDHHGPQQACDRGPLRPQLRARALPRGQRQARPA